MLEKWMVGMRWTARVVGTLMVLLFVFIIGGEAIADGLGPLPGLTLAEVLELVAVIVMLTGAILAWWQELIGGALCVLGGVFFGIVESVDAGQVDVIWFPFVFVAIGVVFVLCSQMKTADVSYRNARRNGG